MKLTRCAVSRRRVCVQVALTEAAQNGLPPPDAVREAIAGRIRTTIEVLDSPKVVRTPPSVTRAPGFRQLPQNSIPWPLQPRSSRNGVECQFDTDRKPYGRIDCAPSWRRIELELTGLVGVYKRATLSELSARPLATPLSRRSQRRAGSARRCGPRPHPRLCETAALPAAAPPRAPPRTTRLPQAHPSPLRPVFELNWPEARSGAPQRN
jgi:hypothetical protein